MLLRRFGGRRRLDLFFLVVFVLGKATGAGCLPASNGVQKKGRMFFFLGAFGFQLDMAFNWTIGHRKKDWEQQDRKSTIVMLARSR